MFFPLVVVRLVLLVQGRYDDSAVRMRRNGDMERRVNIVFSLFFSDALCCQGEAGWFLFPTLAFNDSQK